MDSIFAVAELIERLGGIDGRKRLQKIVYILQQMDFPFDEDFEFGHFGPYSRTLADEIGLLRLNKLVSEEMHENPVGYEYTYKPTEKLLSALNDQPSLRGLDAARLEPVLEVLQDEDTRVLEVASSRLFLQKSGYSGKRLDSALRAWKSNFDSKCFAKANELLRTLEIA